LFIIGIVVDDVVIGIVVDDVVILEFIGFNLNL
jgi:hypothetical protein